MERSLTRMSPALTPSTPAIDTPGSAPCRTRAFEQLVRPGGAVSVKHPHPNYLDEFFYSNCELSHTPPTDFSTMLPSVGGWAVHLGNIGSTDIWSRM